MNPRWVTTETSRAALYAVRVAWDEVRTGAPAARVVILRGATGMGRSGLLQAVFEITAATQNNASRYWPESLVSTSAEPEAVRDVLVPSGFTVPAGTRLPYLWLGLSGSAELAMVQVDSQLRAHAAAFEAALASVESLPKERLRTALNGLFLLGGLVPIVGPVVQALDSATAAIELGDAVRALTLAPQTRMQAALSTSTVRQFSEQIDAQASAAADARLLAELTRWVPAVVVVDDADGLDEISIALLNTLIRSAGSRVLLVLAINADHHPTHPDDIEVDPEVTHNDELHDFVLGARALPGVLACRELWWTHQELIELGHATLAAYDQIHGGYDPRKWALVLSACGGAAGRLVTLLSHGAIRDALTGTAELPSNIGGLTRRTATVEQFTRLSAAHRSQLARVALHGPTTLTQLVEGSVLDASRDSGWLRTRGSSERSVVEFVSLNHYQAALAAAEAEVSPEDQQAIRARLVQGLDALQERLPDLPLETVESLLEALLHDPKCRDMVPNRLAAAYLRLRRTSGREAGTLALLNHLIQRADVSSGQLLIATAEGLADAGYAHRAVDGFNEQLLRLQARYGTDDPRTFAIVRNLAAAWAAHARELPPDDRQEVHQNAINLLEGLVARLKADSPGRIERRLPDTRLQLARLHADAFAYRAAVRHGSACVSEYTRCPDCGPDHLDTLVARLDLAYWTGHARGTVAARDLFAELMPVVERVLGNSHPRTLTTRTNLAIMTGWAGDSVAARDLLAEVVQVREHVLGAEHPETLSSRVSLANWTGYAGDRVAARDLLAGLLSVEERVRGAEHPDTLITKNDLATWTARTGDPVAARDLLAELLPVQERLLGAEHPNTLTTRNNLAFMTGSAGDSVAARDLLAELVPVRERVLGAEHPETLSSRVNLANWTGKAGDRVAAREALAELLPLLERVLGSDHNHTVVARESLAQWFDKVGD